MRNLIQYASGFAAFGCKFNLNINTGELEVIYSPPKTQELVSNALGDIAKYENTANFSDGLAVFVLADKVNDKDNPIDDSVRHSILYNVLGYIDEMGRFYRPLIHSIKVQRSWHGSSKPNDCSYFGKVCTNRAENTGQRGRKTNRAPDEFHVSNTRGISKEQLVTSNLAALYAAIPEENLVASVQRLSSVSMEEMIQQMTPQEAQQWVEKLKARM